MSVVGGSIQILSLETFVPFGTRQSYSWPAGKSDKQSYRLTDIVLMYRQILGAEFENRNLSYLSLFCPKRPLFSLCLVDCTSY